MSFLLSFSRLIDALNEKIGHGISWALLLAVLICSGNASFRYINQSAVYQWLEKHVGLFSSLREGYGNAANSWLEIQWYLFGAIFLLAASYTLRRNEHVRIDVVVSRFSKRTQVWIDLIGFLIFLLPMTLIILYFAVPYAWISIQNQEMSNNAGGLIVWPAKLLIPLGFFLLTLQGISELIKRIGYLQGKVDASVFEKHVTTPQDEIEAIKAANKLS